MVYSKHIIWLNVSFWISLIKGDYQCYPRKTQRKIKIKGTILFPLKDNM